MPGGPLVVAGEQHRGHAGGPDIPDGPGGVWPQGVCQGQKARRAAVYRHIDDGAALLQGRDGSLGQGFPRGHVPLSAAPGYRRRGDDPPQWQKHPGRGASGSPLSPAAPRRSRLASPEQRHGPTGARTGAPPPQSRRRARPGIRPAAGSPPASPGGCRGSECLSCQRSPGRRRPAVPERLPPAPESCAWWRCRWRP